MRSIERKIRELEQCRATATSYIRELVRSVRFIFCLPFSGRPVLPAENIFAPKVRKRPATIRSTAEKFRCSVPHLAFELPRRDPISKFAILISSLSSWNLATSLHSWRCSNVGVLISLRKKNILFKKSNPMAMLQDSALRRASPCRASH